MAEQQITTLLPKEYERKIERKPFAPTINIVKIFIIILILTLLVYGGLIVYERYFLKKQLDKIISAGQQLDLETRISDIKKVIEADKKMELLKQMLNSHIYFSQFFKFIEKNSEGKVYFDKFSADLSSLKVNLSGKAATYSNLAKQIKILSEQKEVKKVDVSNIISLPDGRINFSLEFNFDKSLVLKK